MRGAGIIGQIPLIEDDDDAFLFGLRPSDWEDISSNNPIPRGEGSYYHLIRNREILLLYVACRTYNELNIDGGSLRQC